MKNLSGGQKVKCVIGASMWFCPHIVVLDEPTNYLDRDSLGALSRAIKEFQGGVLMGASFILVALSWDLETALARFPMNRCIIVAAAGIILYGGIGLLSMFLGGEFLDYAELAKVLPVSREMARYHAMLGVEIGVGLTVTAIMFALYANLSSEGKLEGGL